MTQPVASSRGRVREAGFTLIEIIVVVGIIAIMAAVSLPMIGQYIRNFQIRGAAQQVASEIQTARLKAIGRNVNVGVTFEAVDRNTYRYIIEDRPGAAPVMGPLKDLPAAIVFQPPPGANDVGFRYTRLGMYCDPGTAGCQPGPPAGCVGAEVADRCSDAPGNYVLNAAADPVCGAGSRIVVAQPLTGLTRNICVATGGRVRVIQ